VALIVAAVVVPMVLAAIIQAQRAAALKKVAKEA